MRQYIYKIIIAAVALIIVFEFTVGRKFNQINEKIDEIKINNCIKTTRFEILKHKEKKEGFSENVYSKKTKKKIDFFHLGSKNKWREIVPKKFHEKINNIFKEDLKKLKY